MQAIICKFLPVTHARGARIKAKCSSGSMTFDFHSIDAKCKYTYAAEELCKKLGWDYDLQYGILPSGEYVFTMSRKD